MGIKRICFIHTETNGLHQTEKDVGKKYLYNFARLVKLNYEIGIYDGEYKREKIIQHIIKPRACYISEEVAQINGISQEIAEEKGIDPEIVLGEFKLNIKKVDIIVSHNVDFHLKTLIAEATRFNIMIDYNKYIVIDTISFAQTKEYNKLQLLAKKLLKTTETEQLQMIREVFFSLYQKYKQTL